MAGSATQKEDKAPIFVKRSKRRDAEHHGGVWKVAYADFVTAMMAFFLVMWIVTAVNKAERAAIFNYFKNPSMQTGQSTHAAPGPTGPGGASTSPINLGGGLNGMHMHARSMIHLNASGKASGSTGEQRPAAPPSLTAARLKVEGADHQRLESLMAELRQAVQHSQALKPFKKHLLIDITPRGVRIQIVDSKNRAMFDLGSAKLRSYARRILETLAPYLNTVPNQIAIIGHTDAHQYPRLAHYTNWELSADRANAARRALVQGGLDPGKVARVVGLAATVLFDKANPYAPVNRRISIIVMTRREAEAALRADTGSANPPTPARRHASVPPAAARPR
jgi:chemotaxis protein MotB